MDCIFVIPCYNFQQRRAVKSPLSISTTTRYTESVSLGGQNHLGMIVSLANQIQSCFFGITESGTLEDPPVLFAIDVSKSILSCLNKEFNNLEKKRFIKEPAIKTHSSLSAVISTETL